MDGESDNGTTYRAHMTESEPGEARSSHASRFDQLPQGSETVLVTEDEPQILAMIARMLSGQGYNVMAAANGDEALRLAGSPDDQIINLLFTDVMMPRMDGKELATELRIGRPDVKVIFTSGNAEEAVFEQGLPDENAAFLQKPFMLDDLARIVRDVLDS